MARLDKAQARVVWIALCITLILVALGTGILLKHHADVHEGLGYGSAIGGGVLGAAAVIGLHMYYRKRNNEVLEAQN